MSWKDGGQEEDPGNYRLLSLTSVLGKLVEPIFLKVISSHMKDKKVTGNSQYGFTKGRLCLTNLIAFSEMTDSVDEKWMLFNFPLARPLTWFSIVSL